MEIIENLIDMGVTPPAVSQNANGENEHNEALAMKVGTGFGGQFDGIKSAVPL